LLEVHLVYLSGRSLRDLLSNGCGSNGCGLRGKQVLEERTVVEDGFAEILGGGFAAAVSEGDLVGCAIVFDDAGMVDREIGGALLEVGDGIAASGHEEIDEPVCLVDGLSGSVDEAGLDGAPLGDEALVLV
jgi:hypothetical protein